MKKHKFNHMLALISTMALVAGSQTVYAQQGADKAPLEADEIVVTGFKASLQKAAEVKKDTSAIVDLVTSEDIGKLPDKSIAESLMRLPVWRHNASMVGRKLSVSAASLLNSARLY